MKTIGEIFNPDFHEALTLVDGGIENKNIIIDEVESGYIQNEKIIRYATVVVGK